MLSSEFRIPAPCPERLADTIFASYSLSSCVAALFELDAVPYRWEEHPDWHKQLVNWSRARGLQVVELDSTDAVTGYNLRMMVNEEHSIVNEDGSLGNGVEFLLFYGDEVCFNPSGVVPTRVLPGKSVFLPLDPASHAATYN